MEQKMYNYLKINEKRNFFLFAGPCVIESEKMALDIAEKICNITTLLGIPYVFKGSFRKANRSRLDSFTGIGDDKALIILRKVRETYSIPVMTDIHIPEEAAKAAEFVDILQIPAFLCRQTDLLVAAAKTGKMINIKKGQFMSPYSMQFAVAKIRESGGTEVAVTERGAAFGYTDLIVDMRNFPIMKETCGCPIIIDATHSLQQPNQLSGMTGGQPHLINTIASAAIAAGADGVFIETHQNPSMAMSDGANMLQLDNIEVLLRRLKSIRQIM